MFDWLTFYTEKARGMTGDALIWSIGDITETLRCVYGTRDPSEEGPRRYWAEFDSYCVELYERRAGRRTQLVESSESGSGFAAAGISTGE